MESEELTAEQRLELLRNSQTTTVLAAEIQPSPRWYSVALATVIGGFSLYDGGDRSITWLVIGIVATVVVAVHYLPTIKVIPRRSRRTVLGNLAIMAVCWALLTVWGVLSSTGRLDGPGFVRWATIGGLWLATSLALVTAMIVHDRWRHRAILADRSSRPEHEAQ